jgi:hypothetical protein
MQQEFQGLVSESCAEVACDLFILPQVKMGQKNEQQEQMGNKIFC